MSIVQPVARVVISSSWDHPSALLYRRLWEGEASGDASGLQTRSRGKSAATASSLLASILFIFLAFTDLDGLITFRLG
jgi:hypothetical protein